MSTNGSVIRCSIDGKEYLAKAGKYINDVARENGVYIPTLCNVIGIHPQGACRICTITVNGRMMTACTTPVAEGMDIKTNTSELQDLRKSIVELMYVEGNHFCPACEKSGNCELQALAYRFQMMVSRFPYTFPKRKIDARNPKLVKNYNRCILCKRCIRAIKDEQGRSYFAFRKRGHKVEVGIDVDLGKFISDEVAQKAMDICPVGALIKKEQAFRIPIGKRKYDKTPIGADVESHHV
ncbi:MAG: 2Fe-2S iron-sulfur cluster-binding protein [Bacteroidota bacterium]|nr:2Fe-2S iron-sulfur cluster-binding protein [Bacteroidota bacterium]